MTASRPSKNFKPVFIIISASAFMVILAYLITRLIFIYSLTKAGYSLPYVISCLVDRAVIIPCTGVHPCGCNRYYSDKNKPCASGRECLSGACIIDRKTTPDEEDVYHGFCPSGTYDEGMKFELHCGYAKIENGMITKDQRDCVY